MTKACAITECTGTAQAKGMCWTHFNRYRTYGDPLATPRSFKDPSDAIKARTNRDGPVPEHRPELGPCWIWTGATNGTYGRINRGLAHRISYELVKGPIPNGLQIDHLCRRPLCVNPDHLEAVTCRTNLLRATGFVARQAAQTECKYGHLLQGDNLYVDKRSRRHCRECRRRRHREAAVRKQP